MPANLRSLSTITGKTALVQDVSDSAYTDVLHNNTSDNLYKLNCLIAANKSDSSTVSVDVAIERSATDTILGKNIVINAKSSVDLLPTHIHLEPGDKVKVTASSASTVDVTAIVFDDI